MAILIVVGIWPTVVLCDGLQYVASVASAQGDSVRIGVGVVGGTAFAGKSIVVEASMLGSCQNVAIVTPVPAPIAAVDTEQSFIFTIRPADLQRIYFYRARFVDEHGVLTDPPTYPYYANGDYVSCREAIAARGRLSRWLSVIQILTCTDQCWAACDQVRVEMPADSASWEGYVDTGQVVDLYGEVSPPWTLWTIPGTPCMTVTRIEPVPDPAGCSAVAVESTTWGGIKAKYR
jgi:hypothetical protein